MNYERLQAILAEKKTNHPLYAAEGFKYFDEAIPALLEVLKPKVIEPLRKVVVKVPPKVEKKTKKRK